MVRYLFVLLITLGRIFTTDLMSTTTAIINTTSSLAGTSKDSSACSGSSCIRKTCITIKDLYQYLFGPCSLQNKIAVAEDLRSRVVDPTGRDKDEAHKLDKYIVAMKNYQIFKKDPHLTEDHGEIMEKEMKDAEVDLRNWYQKTFTHGTRTALGIGALACIYFGGKEIKKALWSPKGAEKAFVGIDDELSESGNASNFTKPPGTSAPTTKLPFFNAMKIFLSISIIIVVVVLADIAYKNRARLGFGGDGEEEDSKSKPKEGSKEKSSSGQEGGKVSSLEENITTTTSSSKVLTSPGSKIAATPVDSKIAPATGSKVAAIPVSSIYSEKYTPCSKLNQVKQASLNKTKSSFI